jgi:hypothetical protein
MPDHHPKTERCRFSEEKIYNHKQKLPLFVIIIITIIIMSFHVKLCYLFIFFNRLLMF